MNPPLRSRADRDALLAGITDGTIEVIATDHAPHTAAEKSRGLAASAMGVVGLECAFPLLYKYMVLPGIVTLEKLVALMAVNPPPDIRPGRRVACRRPGRLYGAGSRCTGTGSTLRRSFRWAGRPRSQAGKYRAVRR